MHPADAAVQARHPAAAPEEHRPAVAAVLRAFAEYAEGRDDSALAALAEVGRLSPLAEWKLLLRGLIAYSGTDDGRALENWQRLAPDRLPARLAAPLRAKLDPGYAATQPPAVAARLQDQWLAVEGDAVGRALHELRRELGRDQPLAKAFTICERLVGLLRPGRPALAARVGQLMYWSVQRFGQPSDAAKLLRVFGRPPDDPDFHRMNALGYERESPVEAIAYWSRYEKWLATGPPSVAAATATQARVKVLTRVAELAAEAGESAGPPDEMFEAFRAIFVKQGRGTPLMVARPKPPDPVPFWRQALQLDPASEDAALGLIDHHFGKKQFAQADLVAQALLRATPDSVAALDARAKIGLLTGDPTATLESLLKVRALNPLDTGLPPRLAVVYFAAARQQLAAGRLDEGLRLVAEGEPFVAEPYHVGAHVLRSLLALKRGDADAAARHEASALADPKSRLSAALMFAADAALLKLKPAHKKPHDARLAGALKAPTRAAEVVPLLRLALTYDACGLAYRGLATHVKKVQEMLLKSVEGDGESTAAEFIAACVALAAGKLFKLLEKFADGLGKRFVTNPYFPLFAAEAVHGLDELGGGGDSWRKIDRYTRVAFRLAARGDEATRKAVHERLATLKSPPEHFGGGF